MTDDRGRAWALPPEARWFFLWAPPILALLFDPHCASTADNVGRAWLSLTLFTVVVGLAVHRLFEVVAHPTRGLSAPARIVVHAASTTGLVAALTWVLHPAVVLLYPEVGDDVPGMIWRGVIISFLYLALARFIGHLQERAVAEQTRAHAEREAALEARLAALTAQLQPHFLFNALNVCAGLVVSAPDAAEAMLDRLAAFLRYAVESSQRRLVPLAEELDATRAYLAIQGERFGARLRHEVVGPIDGALPSVPPMLLQPLVENAVKYGLDQEDGGLVRIACRREPGRFVIEVEDGGRAQRADVLVGTGTGQRSVRERLRLVYGETAALVCGPRAEGGYRSQIILPLEGA